MYFLAVFLKSPKSSVTPDSMSIPNPILRGGVSAIVVQGEVYVNRGIGDRSSLSGV